MTEQIEQHLPHLAEIEKTVAGYQRALEIEVALERVRARAMDMQHSFELSDVLSVLFEQYDVLGICPVFSHLTLFDIKNNRFTYRTTGRDGRRVQAEQVVPIDAVDAWKEAVENWKKGGPNMVDSHVYPKEILPYVFQLFQDILSTIPADARYFPEDFPDGLYITQGYCKFGYVGFGHIRPATEEEKELVRRIAIEFERLYERFLDLQKSEARIREAQIETSLERVRASAMSMRGSDDVSNAIGLLFSEMDKLGLAILRCGLIVIDEKDRSMQVWRATATEDGTIGQTTGKVSMSIHPMLEMALDYWKRKESFLRYDLFGQDLVNYYSALTNHAPQFLQHLITEQQTCSSFFFDEGAVFVFSKEPLNEEICSILKRFTAVFSLTYRRYLDLKMAEAQAREAARKASLDRIRAEIASMRTAADLQKITPLIWNELTVLGVPFIRCGVFIMDDEQEVSHTYLATPDGRAVAAFDLPYDSPGNVGSIVRCWQQKQLYTEYWTEKDYALFASGLVENGVFASPEQYLSSLPKDGFYIHFVPFLQGMLYVGNTTQLGEREIELVHCIADAFSTAYARYEDFVQLAAAKQEVEKTLLELKQAQQLLIQSEKMASLGQLTAGIAHEIQNPLNFINNFSVINAELIAEMLEEINKGNWAETKIIAADLKKNEEKVSFHGKRAESIVKSMLQHTRTPKDQKEPVAINRLCDEYLRLSYQGFRAKYKTFSADLHTEFDQYLENIDIVPQEVGRVLLNLLDNAFYAVQQKKQNLNGIFQPQVSISTKKENEKAVIMVSDNGPGISAGDGDKIFQPFFTTKPTGEGTGLGLSVSYDVIRAHEGIIKVETKEGEGTAFIIELPLK